MPGTTISASSTIGIQLTLPSQNPVLVTSTGTIDTTASYAISDTAPATLSGEDFITNNGVLQGQYGIEFNGPSAVGIVDNLGKIVATNNYGIYLEDEGDVNNGSATDKTASITSGNADTIFFNPQAQGTDLVINYGTISASVYAVAVNAISMDAGQGNQVINYGTVSSVNFGVVTSGPGPTTINNGSTTDSTAVITGLLDSGSGTDVVSNYGTIVGDSETGDSIEADGSGPLTVTNAGVIDGADTGIYAASLGTVINTGFIVGGVSAGDGIALTAGGSVTNGSATDTTASIDGATAIILGNSPGLGVVIQTPSQVTNFGTIDGTGGDAITTNDTGPVTITNGSVGDTKALITSTFWSIATGVVTLANFGTIAGSAIAVDVAGGSAITNGSTADTVATIKGDTGVASSNAGNSTVNNFGTIATTGSGALIGDGVTLTGSLTNGSATDTKALITASADGVGANGITTVTNFGTISGAAGWGVALNSGTIDNFGTIVGGSGGITTGNGANVVNSGTIASSTTAGTALDYLTTGGTLVNDAGGVIGTTSGRLPTVVNDGTIVAGNGPGGLDVFSSVDSSSSGVFQLTGKSVLEIAAYLGTNLKIQFLGSTPTNELIVDNPANFGLNVGAPTYAGPLLEGFTTGDQILLKGIANPVLNYSSLTGELQLTSAGKPVATLLFQNSSLGPGTFHVTSESGTNYLITHS